MASNRLFINHNIRLFFFVFQKNSAMATLGLKEMGKFLRKGKEKSLPSWQSQFSYFVPEQGMLGRPVPW